MQAIANTSLKYIDLVLLENWSVQSLLDAQFNYSKKFELARIGDFLFKSRNIVNIEDDKEYNRVTVKINNNGVILRDTEKGINIGTKKQYKAKAGQFIISKIDARNGAFGIIPNELSDAIVTNDFPLFDVNTKRINPQFLLLITTTKVFIKFAQSCSSGTTNRQRMDIDMFLNQKIPLPKLEEQDKIVSNYLSKMNEAERLKNEANDLESGIEKYLYEALEITNTSGNDINKGLQIVEFINIDKWSFDDIFKKNKIISKKYELANLNSLCSLITDGTHQTPKYFKEGIIFLSAKNVTKEIIDWSDIKYVSREAHNEYIRRVKPQLGDILLAKNGTTGVAAIIDIEQEFSIYVSLALLKPIKERVNPKYLLYLINSKIARTQFHSRLIGIGVPNLHLGEIKEVVIPLPSLEIQQKIVNHISDIKIQIAKINTKAKKFETEAKEQFEKTIFNS